MHVKLKNEPSLTLMHLLKRRKRTLKQFIDEFGITTYTELCNRCNRMGIVGPAEEEFKKLNLPRVSDPSEGVVVVDIVPVEQKEKRNKRKTHHKINNGDDVTVDFPKVDIVDEIFVNKEDDV